MGGAVHPNGRALLEVCGNPQHLTLVDGLQSFVAFMSIKPGGFPRAMGGAGRFYGMRLHQMGRLSKSFAILVLSQRPLQWVELFAVGVVGLPHAALAMVL